MREREKQSEKRFSARLTRKDKRKVEPTARQNIKLFQFHYFLPSFAYFSCFRYDCIHSLQFRVCFFFFNKLFFVVIGAWNNTRTVIRKGKVLIYLDTPNVLHSNRLTEINIEIFKGNVRFFFFYSTICLCHARGQVEKQTKSQFIF